MSCDNIILISFQKSKIERRSLVDKLINELNNVANFPAIPATSNAYRSLSNAAAIHLEYVKYVEDYILELENIIIESENE